MRQNGGHEIHPFLRGNFAPVEKEYISYPCEVIYGEIPDQLLGGQYIRNGGNPVYPPGKGRHYHWFDGDGMLHGVLFPQHKDGPPLYTNRHLATSLMTMTLLLLRSPIPSIALLISPLSSLPRIIAAILQAFFLAVRARLGVLSVANTSVVWWGTGLGSDETPSGDSVSDHRLLATCESGPPLEVRVPELETVGWDRLKDSGTQESLATRRGGLRWWQQLSLSRVQEDWMTAHPKVDPVDGSLLFYSTQMFEAPHARYSVIDDAGKHLVWKEGVDIGRAKMMHDFAATRTHTILLNLPLTLSPANLFSIPPLPLIHFDRSLSSEYVVFPRLLRSAQTPQEPIRFIESDPCLMFHTANAWDEYARGETVAINMLACRFKSAKLVYATGAIDIPLAERQAGRDDVVHLYYYRFELPQDYVENRPPLPTQGAISHSFPLMTIPFEFPTIPSHLSMSDSRYVYGCSMKSGSFDERLGGAAKVDCLVKVDVRELVGRGREGNNGIEDPVDKRSTLEILEDQGKGLYGPISVFALPGKVFAQETRFVPRKGCDRNEAEGFLLTYVYDENNLDDDGKPRSSPKAGSELWVIDANRMDEGMAAVACRIKLPQRVPYGLHGTWIPASLAKRQRTLKARIEQPLLQDKLHKSRLQYFASILFDRPPNRPRSRFENAVLAIMWPMSVVMLLLAMFETTKHIPDYLGWSDVSRYPSTIVHEAHTFPWPQLISGVLIIGVLFIYGSRSGKFRIHLHLE